jgi:hypothetical protein
MRIVLSIIACLFCFSSFSQNATCKDYKTGRFILHDKETKMKFSIERNDSIQTETDLKTGEVAKFRVYWESECKYSLKILECRQDLMDFFKDKALHVEIIEIYKDGYKFSAKADGIDMILYQTVRKSD